MCACVHALKWSTDLHLGFLLPAPFSTSVFEVSLQLLHPCRQPSFTLDPGDPSLDTHAILQVPTHPATPSTSLLNAFIPAFPESPPRSTTWIQPFKADFWGIKTKNEREGGSRIQGTKLGWYRYHFLIALGLTRQSSSNCPPYPISKMCTELVPLLLTIFVPAVCHLWVPSTHTLLGPFFFLTSAIATSPAQVNTAKRKTSNTLQPGASSSARVGAWASDSRTDIPASHLLPCLFLTPVPPL